MFLLHRPPKAEIDSFLAAQSALPFSYTEVGATRHPTPPPGYPVNRYRGRLGSGREDYRRAVAALCSWRMYRTGWTEAYPPDAPVREGEVVAVLASHLGFRSLNACRIIYTFDDEGPVTRRGFAFGTLPQHAERGEERFAVEWDRRDGGVYYDLYAFARPQPLIAKLGYPVVRLLQKRFARESYRAMTDAVAGRAPPDPVRGCD